MGKQRMLLLPFNSPSHLRYTMDRTMRAQIQEKRDQGQLHYPTSIQQHIRITLQHRLIQTNKQQKRKQKRAYHTAADTPLPSATQTSNTVTPEGNAPRVSSPLRGERSQCVVTPQRGTLPVCRHPSEGNAPSVSSPLRGERSQCVVTPQRGTLPVCRHPSGGNAPSVSSPLRGERSQCVVTPQRGTLPVCRHPSRPALQD